MNELQPELTAALGSAADAVEHHLAEVRERAVDPLVPVHERATALVELSKVGSRLAKLVDKLQPVHQLPVVPGRDSGLYGKPPG